MKKIRKANEQAMNLSQLADHFQLDWRTIKKYVLASEESLNNLRRKKSHPFQKEIIELEASKLTVREIHGRLIELGFTGAFGATKNTVAAIRKRKRKNHPLTEVEQCKRTQIANYFWKSREHLDPEQTEWLQYLFEQYSELKELHSTVQAFRQIIAARNIQQLEVWVDEQRRNKKQPFHHYAIRLNRDWDAVTNALNYSYSNGFVEGQVNRLKTEKRLLYGRANVALLEKRLTYQW